MKKIVAFLLCLCMLLPLSSCFADKLRDDDPIKTDDASAATDIASESTSDELTTPPTEEPPKAPSANQTEETRYYKIEKTDAGKTKYEIYDLEEKVVLSGETEKPLAIYMLNEHVVEIRLGKEPNDVRKFYDLINNCFSEDYSNLLTRTAELAVCVEKESNGTVLVAKSLFGNEVYKEYPLQDLATTEQPFRTFGIEYGKLWLTYDTKDGTTRRTVLPILEPDYDYFTDYGSIVRLADEIRTAIEYYEDHVDYRAVFGITDAQERETYDKLFSSMLAFYPPQAEHRQSIQYAVKDLNRDGIFELILLCADLNIVAIFSKVNGKPVLLDHFWHPKHAYIDHRGLIYMREINARVIYQVAEGGASLELVAKFGFDNHEWIGGVRVADYYKIENGQKVSILEEEYNEIAAQYSFPGLSLTEYCARFQTAYTHNDSIAHQADARQAYLDALEGRIKVYNTTTNEQIYLRDCKTPYMQAPLSDVANLGYAQVDLDGNGVQEFVIECGDTLILRYYEGTVYLYEFTFRNLYYLNANGTYSWNHNGVDFEYGEKRIAFDGVKLALKELWRIVNDGEPNAEYYIDIQRVTKEELLRYLDEMPKVERLEFKPLTLPLGQKITSEEAWKIANAHWRDAEGRTDGACSTRLTARVFLQADPYDNIGDYHFVLLSEHRHSFSDVEGCSDVCYVSINKHVLVDAITGECKPYVEYSYDGK